MNERDAFVLQLLTIALENPLIAIALAGTLIVFVIAGYIVLFYVIPGMLLRAGARKLEALTAPKDAHGQQVGRTFGAKVMGQRDIAPLSSRGMNAKAEMSLGTTVMRTTWGMRLSTVFFSALAIVVVFTMDFSSQMGTPEGSTDFILQPLVVGFALLALAHVFSYELRYDRDGMVSQSLIQFRKEMDWRDLADIKDEGHGTFRLTGANGKKIRVQKFLVGMGDFLTVAHEHMRGRVGYA